VTEQPPKRPWQSTTIWAGAAQLVGGLVMVVIGLMLPEQHADLVPAGIGVLTTGAATIRGRLVATRPIG
jgi:VIT1/CCC1 family predicted Fe2+/Mn2+ transporter